MRNYNNPWEQKEQSKIKAREWTKYVSERYPTYIEDSAKYTSHLFTDGIPLAATKGELPEIRVLNTDSVKAAFQCTGRTAILDFASYKNPGGMFFEGSMAQEEALCHASALYPILSSDRLMNEFYLPNRKRLNKSLYHDNLLYVPAVPFKNPDGDNWRLFDVIIAAAPNKGSAQKYQNVPDSVCDEAMRGRIRAVLEATDSSVNLMFRMPPENVVLGAFGCGVFKNDPRTVARMFREELHGRKIKAVFATPGDKFDIFRSVILSDNN